MAHLVSQLGLTRINEKMWRKFDENEIKIDLEFQNIITWLKYTILIKYIRINHARLETMFSCWSIRTCSFGKLTGRSSAIWEKSWSLIWEWSSLTSIISGAPSSSLAESGTSAFPGLGALLGTLPVVWLGDWAVLVVWVSGSVFGEITLPEFLSVIIVLSVGWDVSVSESNSWWGTCWDSSEEGGDGKSFHCYMFSNIIIKMLQSYLLLLKFHDWIIKLTNLKSVTNILFVNRL